MMETTLSDLNKFNLLTVNCKMYNVYCVPFTLSARPKLDLIIKIPML